MHDSATDESDKQLIPTVAVAQNKFKFSHLDEIREMIFDLDSQPVKATLPSTGFGQRTRKIGPEGLDELLSARNRGVVLSEMPKSRD